MNEKPTIVLDGKQAANTWIERIKQTIVQFEAIAKRKMKLLIIQVDHNFASTVYIKNKKRVANNCGVEVVHRNYLGIELTTEKLVKKLQSFQQLLSDKSPQFDGILVQLPLPKHLDELAVLNALKPEFDVDGFSAATIAKMWASKTFDPFKNALACTPKGIIQLLNYYKIALEKQHVVIINRSNIVGKPLAAMMLAKNATVTICHSYTPNIAQLCKTANIIVSGVGQVGFLTKNYVNKNCVVIDVSINRDANNHLCGDVKVDEIAPICHGYSPVPGGVGPMTVVAVFDNLAILAMAHWQRQKRTINYNG